MNFDNKLSTYIEKERSPLVKLLIIYRHLKSLVAQRHSYKPEILRYFERHYLDSSQHLTRLTYETLVLG
ncbi:hypothetical protein [Nostoc piscinale]|uniref:hypothetical protein n=1 Tax=Nostoc piscinale TaxID=224012 RepID=UPI0011877368|nr:hypothetical protein [Nostoc piscinale]